MKSLFESETYKEVMERVGHLEPASKGLWGKMNAGQMVWHCQIPLNLAIRNKPTSKKGNLIIKWLFKKSLYNDRPFRKNLPTTPFAKAKEDKDFEVEREKLLAMITEFHNLRERASWNAHPIFGDLTHEQWGKLQYKHLDHHLRQFGV